MFLYCMFCVISIVMLIVLFGLMTTKLNKLYLGSHLKLSYFLFCDSCFYLCAIAYFTLLLTVYVRYMNVLQ